MKNCNWKQEKGISLINLILLICVIILVVLLGYEIIYNDIFNLGINSNFLYADSGVEDNTLPKIEEIDSMLNTQIDGTNKEHIGNHYYYNQLDNNAKIIYNGLEKNIEEMKTGTYKIDFDKKFNDLLNSKGGSEKLTIAFQSAWNAFTYDYMDVFYIDVSKLILTTRTTTIGPISTHRVHLSNDKYSSYLSSNITSNEDLESKIEYLSKVRKTIVKQLDGYSDYDKIKHLHNWIINNFEYDTTYQFEDIYNVYGAFANRKAVCEGYARAFKYILDGLGIENILVTGEATNGDGERESHAWNYVKLERKVVCHRCNLG